MTMEIALCLGILCTAIGLFAWDKIPADVVALGVMLASVVLGLLTPAQAFAGFASDTILMILGLLIMTAGLGQTGVVDFAGRKLVALIGGNETYMLPAVMVSVAFLSAFISNTAATAFFIPIVLGFAAKSGVSPSKYLLPLAFASIVTSSVTLISTSTNVVVSELMTQQKMPPMGMFELAPVGLPIAVLGLLYMWLAGVRLMPERAKELSADDVGERDYHAELVVLPDSALAGKPVAETRLGGDSGLGVVEIVRDGVPVAVAGSTGDTVLNAGDDVRVTGKRADVLKVKEIAGVELRADVHHTDDDTPHEALTIVEGTLLPHSPLIGATLKSAEFKDRYGLQVLAINRGGLAIPQKLSRVALRLGDVLLLQGTPENVKALEQGNLFSIFGGVDHTRLNVERAPLAAAIFGAALTLATLKLTPLPIAVLSGAFFMLLFRCISPEEAYRQVEWKVLILIGALFSLGAAMDTTGTGRFLAQQLINVAGDQPPWVMLTCFFVLTLTLTQPMSNQAAVIVVVPIAIATAQAMDLNPRTFAMMVAVAASCSYLTPLEPSCLMVYGPGRYRFSDFFKVGLPLTILIYGLAILLVPIVWPP
ncbi:MAG: SLC13 family permease [Micropepsaceae bacterium]